MLSAVFSCHFMVSQLTTRDKTWFLQFLSLILMIMKYSHFPVFAHQVQEEAELLEALNFNVGQRHYSRHYQDLHSAANSILPYMLQNTASSVRVLNTELCVPAGQLRPSRIVTKNYVVGGKEEREAE
jgi:hypothetical protein